MTTKEQTATERPYTGFPTERTDEYSTEGSAEKAAFSAEDNAKVQSNIGVIAGVAVAVVAVIVAVLIGFRFYQKQGKDRGEMNMLILLSRVGHSIAHCVLHTSYLRPSISSQFLHASLVNARTRLIVQSHQLSINSPIHLFLHPPHRATAPALYVLFMKIIPY